MTHLTVNLHIDADTPVVGHDLAKDTDDSVSIVLGDVLQSVTLLGPVDAVSDALTRAIGEIVAIRAARAEVAPLALVGEAADKARWAANAEPPFIGSGWR